MKQILIGGAFMLVFGGLNAQGFEGGIKITANDAAHPVEMKVKGDKVLIEDGTMQNRPDTRIILNAKTGDYFVLTSKSGFKKALKFNILDNPNGEMVNPFEAAKQKPEKIEAETAEVNFKSTGQTKTVDGYACKLYKVDTDKETAEIWVTDEVDLAFSDIFPVLNMAGNKGSGTGFDDKGFIMEMIVRDKASAQTSSYSVDLEPEKLDKDIFEVPSDAKILDMSDIIQQLRDAGDDPEKIQEVMKAFN